MLACASVLSPLPPLWFAVRLMRGAPSLHLRSVRIERGALVSEAALRASEHPDPAVSSRLRRSARRRWRRGHEGPRAAWLSGNRLAKPLPRESAPGKNRPCGTRFRKPLTFGSTKPFAAVRAPVHAPVRPPIAPADPRMRPLDVVPAGGALPSRPWPAPLGGWNRARSPPRRRGRLPAHRRSDCGPRYRLHRDRDRAPARPARASPPPSSRRAVFSEELGRPRASRETRGPRSKSAAQTY